MLSYLARCVPMHLIARIQPFLQFFATSDTNLVFHMNDTVRNVQSDSPFGVIEREAAMSQEFIEAATAGDVSKVRAMLRDDPALARVKDENGVP